MERLGKGLGDAAIGEDDGGEFSVIETQPLALQFQQRHTVALLGQYGRVVGWGRPWPAPGDQSGPSRPQANSSSGDAARTILPNSWLATAMNNECDQKAG
jgi:hypothetical protein